MNTAYAIHSPFKCPAATAFAVAVGALLLSGVTPSAFAVPVDGTGPVPDQTEVITKYVERQRNVLHHGELRKPNGIGFQLYDCKNLDDKGNPKGGSAFAILQDKGKVYGFHGYLLDSKTGKPKPFWLPLGDSQADAWNAPLIGLKNALQTSLRALPKKIDWRNGSPDFSEFKKALITSLTTEKSDEAASLLRQPNGSNRETLAGALLDLLTSGTPVPEELLSGSPSENIASQKYAYIKLDKKIAGTASENGGVDTLLGDVNFIAPAAPRTSALRQLKTFLRNSPNGGKFNKAIDCKDRTQTPIAAEPYTSEYRFSGDPAIPPLLPYGKGNI